MVRALGIQSRGQVAILQDKSFRQARAKQAYGSQHRRNDHGQDFLSSTVYNSSGIRGSHDTTSCPLQTFPFVAATNDASARDCECVRGFAIRRTRQGI